MTAVRLELRATGKAHIGTAIVDHRRGRTHALDGVSVAQIQLFQRIVVEEAVLGYCHRVEISALGGKVITISLFVIADGAANVRIQPGQTVDHAAGAGIEREQVGAGRDISGFAVIRAHDHKAIRNVRARPVEAALLGVSPGRLLRLVRLGGVFIRDRQADPVAVVALAVPEASIDIAVVIGDGRIGLTAQRICIDPQRFQRIRVERLNRTVGEGDEEHSLRIGRRRDVKGGLFNHVAHLHDLARHRVDFEDILLRRADQIAVYENRRADRVRAIADARLIGPVHHCV